ncbi:putative peptidoglycan glycosyltransferase FtsW [Parvularcula sp. LCG005]|uniref:FtsW/RodA/SpoVE family cell cycle protein n=1 Tax=Parvularcula sp. LCG005 TaxID=3078805 RepID=UPI002943C05D|nr:putative peptidoglycan glycosyltransferase FtsW [Parvularcula sp. LCG005]WOI52124.1 putative peptidoglycan glycosyltransferase FtsW [Parvularcula sp. LCG005]
MDKPLLYLILGLVLIGIVMCTAAGPVAAMRMNIDNPLHFVERQFLFLCPALVIMIGCSLLTPAQARRVGVVVGGGALVLMIAALFIGPEIKGAHRWLSLAGFSLQPSEFFKPGFVMLTAWLLAEAERDKRFPGGALSLGLFALGAFTLLMQPDYGQLVLLTAIWGVMFFIAGWSWGWVLGLGAAMTGIITFGYQFAPHVRSRIDRFLAPESGDTYQVDSAIEAIAGGGLLGHNLNDMPSVKDNIPDAHTDFIFAVAAEEFGFILGAGIIILFGAIVYRSLRHAEQTKSLFVRCAIAGLTAQLAFQAMVNIGVSLAILPAKGMTLPFISYGGSSLLATGLTAGLLLALTRRSAAHQ